MTTERVQEFINTFCRTKEDCDIIISFLKETGDEVKGLTTISYSIKEELKAARNEIKRIDSRAKSLAWSIANGGIPNV
jgi:hypothetical protein